MNEQQLIRFAELALDVAKPSQTGRPWWYAQNRPTKARRYYAGEGWDSGASTTAVVAAERAKSDEQLLAEQQQKHDAEEKKSRARFLKYARELLAALTEAQK